MTDAVRLVINCQDIVSHANTALLSRLYSGRFGSISFAVGQGLPEADQPHLIHCPTVRPPDVSAACPCCPSEADHHALTHCFHNRLVEIANSDLAEDWLLFVQDDCLIAPWIDQTYLLNRSRHLEALIPEIWYCHPGDNSWVWTNHETGRPALLNICDRLDERRLLDNWQEYAGSSCAAGHFPMFAAFTDWLLIRSDVLKLISPTLDLLGGVWMEAAIPTALLNHTARIGKSDGIALWDQHRRQPLSALLGYLRRSEFVHPIKLSQVEPEQFIEAYRSIGDQAWTSR